MCAKAHILQVVSYFKHVFYNPYSSIDGKTVAAIQCDINITEGNSGGALLNKNGELVGVTTFRLKDSKNNVVYGISFSIPIKTIKNFINSN